MTAERAHGDRVDVSVDSPESLDEVFWRVFDGPGYIRATSLAPHAPPAPVVGKYRAYVAAILNATSPPATRYLAKNNNNILRLPAIRAAFPNALILVPFREPLAHAGSLLRMHRGFTVQQSADPFVREYMGWLGHHEFGLDHRPFRLADDAPGGSRDMLGYWLERWIEAYGWLVDRLPEGAMFVCYEDLCRDPGVWARIARLADVPVDHPAYEPFLAGPGYPATAEVDPARLAVAEALYARLRALTGAAP